jgi:hypothetical protein
MFGSAAEGDVDTCGEAMSGKEAISQKLYLTTQCVEEGICTFHGIQRTKVG